MTSKTSSNKMSFVRYRSISTPVPPSISPVLRRKKEEQDNSDDLIGDLFDAISDGNTRIVSHLLREAKRVDKLLGRKDLQGLTPLKKAITLNKADIARILVANGASPNVRDPLGKTPLHIAVMQGRRELLAPLLVSVDSSVNVQDKSGWTPLHYAIRGKHLKVLEWLLYAGADVNIKNKDEESPLEVTEEESLMRKMLLAYNVDRDVYPVILSSAFISKKELNYIGTDGLLLFVTSPSWSPSEQFFFCKRIRPNEASPNIPLRWNEHFYSDVYHYRTMRRLSPGETRVKLFILYFEELKFSEIVLKITSKEKFLGEVPLQRSTYVQDKHTNFMGSCELDIKHEGQFVVVKRFVSMHLRKNEDGVLSCEKYSDFLCDLPQGSVPNPPKDWNNTRLERAKKERDRLLAIPLRVEHSQTKIDYLQEFYEQTYTEEEEKGKSPVASPPKTPPVLKLDRSTASNASLVNQEDAGEDVHPSKTNDVGGSDIMSVITLEPMLEAYEPDDCDDFYYISRGWGLYLTVMQAFPLTYLLHSTAMEKIPIRCTSPFYQLYHTSEQNPRSDCLIQIPKTGEFAKVGTVLVFARKAVAPQDESPDPDDSSQEYMLSDDMKTTWGVYWQNQERDRWSLIPTGIVNKRTRVIFKTRTLTSFIVVQLSSGDERSDKEADDDSSSEDEEEEPVAGEEEEEGEKEEKAHSDGEEGEATEGAETARKKSKKIKKRKKSAASSFYGLDDQMCLLDEPDSEEEERMAIEEEAEGGEGEDAPAQENAEAAAEGGAEGAEDTGEPGAPNPSPMVNKEENNKDENASNIGRDWSNNNSSVNREAAQENRNNNQIRDNDEDYDQSSLAPEERTLIVGLPAAQSSFVKLSVTPSVFRSKTAPISEEDEGAEDGERATEDTASELKSSTAEPARPGSSQDEAPVGSGVPGLSRSIVSQQEEVLSDEELPVVTTRKLSIVVVKNGVKELQGFKFGPKLPSLPLVGVDMDQIKTYVALMWRFRNHTDTSVLIFSRARGEGEFDMIIDVVKTTDTYVRAESHYSAGFKMVAESQPLPIKTGRFLSFVIEGPLLVEKCQGGVPNSQGTLRTRMMYFSHSQTNSIEYVVKRPQVEEVKGPQGKKGKRREEVKVDTEPDARLEVMGFNAGSGTNGVDLAAMTIWLNGADLWHERHVQLRASDNKLLSLLIECLTRSKALARNWWRLIILLGYTEKEVEKEKGRTAPSAVVGMYVRKWFEDCLNHNDRGILRLIQSLHVLDLDIAIDNVVRILKVYKAHLVKEPVRPRYLKLLFHWVLQTKMTRNNLLKAEDPPIMRPVSDVFLLHLSNFLPKQDLFKIGAAMEVEENVLHAIAGEDIIKDEAYLGFRVLVKSRQKKDEIIHYTLLLLEMFKQVELPEANEVMITETKKWMETVADTDPDICNKLDNVFG